MVNPRGDCFFILWRDSQRRSFDHWLHYQWCPLALLNIFEKMFLWLGHKQTHLKFFRITLPSAEGIIYFNTSFIHTKRKTKQCILLTTITQIKDINKTKTFLVFHFLNNAFVTVTILCYIVKPLVFPSKQFINLSSDLWYEFINTF
jgi:hypothetical protein